MSDEFYGRRHPPPSQAADMERLSASFAKLFGTAGGGTGFGSMQNNLLNHQNATSNHHHPRRESTVITQQPFGSQVSNTSSMGMIPLNWCPSQIPISPHRNIQTHHHVHPHLHAPIQIHNSHHGDPPPPEQPRHFTSIRKMGGATLTQNQL